MSIVKLFTMRTRWKPSSKWYACIALLTVTLLPSCGSSQLETAPVRGTITLDGRPLGKGQVLFTPLRGRGGKGLLNPDGTYMLTTYAEGDGALVGLHQVAISPVISLNKAVAEDETVAEPLIPARYGVGSTSGLTYEIKANQQNQADFDLRSQ